MEQQIEKAKYFELAWSSDSIESAKKYGFPSVYIKITLQDLGRLMFLHLFMYECKHIESIQTQLLNTAVRINYTPQKESPTYDLTPLSEEEYLKGGSSEKLNPATVVNKDGIVITLLKELENGGLIGLCTKKIPWTHLTGMEFK